MRRNMPFLFDDFCLKHYNTSNIYSVKNPYVRLSHYTSDCIVVMQYYLEDLYDEIIKSEIHTKEIDLGSKKQIISLAEKKIENLPRINIELKRDRTGFYGVDDYLRGRLGEIFADCVMKTFLKNIDIYYGVFDKYNIKSYHVRTVEEITSKRFILKRKNNDIDHGNYYLYYLDSDIDNEYHNLEGEFDFAYEVQYVNNDDTVINTLLVGESKTGQIKINAHKLKKNLKRLYNSQVDYLIYVLIAPYEECYDIKSSTLSKSVVNIYKKTVHEINREMPYKDKIKLMIMPVKGYENREAKKEFYSIGKEACRIIGEILDKERITLKIIIGNYKHENKNPLKNRISMERKIDLNKIYEDARKLSKKDFVKKYGNEVYVPLR